MNLIKLGGGTKNGDHIHYDWNGASGITSSSAAANNVYTSLGIRDYGYDLWNRPAPATMEGVEIESSTSGGPASVAVKYTWMGDMDLDGKVTVQDYNLFTHYYFNHPPTDDITWMTGDFNYDGQINLQDYNMFVQGYFHASGTLSADEQIPNWAPIPEPATLVLLALGTAAVLRRRRRKA